MSIFDPNRGALVLVDATYLGDGPAAEKWNCTKRTVENYRARLAVDPDFSALFASKLRATEVDLRGPRRKTLKAGLEKMHELIGKANKVEDLVPVTNAVKVLGELDITAEALSVGDDDDQPGEGAEEDSGEPAEGAAGKEYAPGSHH